jgi:glycosyltransferase involved in cell wall biosynthesis
VRKRSDQASSERAVSATESARVDRMDEAMLTDRQDFRIAYAIQNVGNVDFGQDLGATILVRQTLSRLHDRGHQIVCLRLQGQSVVQIDDISRPNECRGVPRNISDTRIFKLIESVARRLQRELKLPYFALFDTFRFYRACCAVLPAFQICHEHNGILSAGAAIASWRLGIPYILTFDADPLLEAAVSGAPFRGIRRQAAALAARITFRVARRIICVSEATKEQLADTWGVSRSKIVVVPNGVDVERFRPDYDASRIRARLGLGDAPVVGFVGGFQRWHGLDNLVASFAEVASAVPDSRLLLIGDGSERPAVTRRINELGIAAKVVMTGLVSQRQVPEMLAAIDVAVLPYPALPRELWFSPLKLYEYMAAGRAIVASRSGQVADVVNDGDSGVLVTAGDVTELTRAIIMLLNDGKLRARLGHNARQQAVERHSWDSSVTVLEGIYAEVLQSAS